MSIPNTQDISTKELKTAAVLAYVVKNTLGKLESAQSLPESEQDRLAARAAIEVVMEHIDEGEGK